MRRSLWANIGLGTLALILGFLVWIGATFEANPPATQVVASAIPIEIVNKPQGLVIRNQSATQVRLTVRGREESLKRLTTGSFRVVADLNGLKEGLQEVPLRVETSDKSITIIKCDPPSIGLTLDLFASTTKSVEVEVLDKENVPIGYAYGTPTVEPEKVDISGPKTLVDQVARASVSLRMERAKDTVERKIAPRLLDAQGRVVSGLTPEPPQVTVRVPVMQELGFRDVTVRAIITGSPASGYWTSNIRVQPTTVTLFGLPHILDEMRGFVETVPVDISGAKENVTQRVALNLPPGTSLLSEEAQKGVQVTVEISPIIGGQTVQRPIERQGLGLGLTAKVSPATVDVILAGPLPALQALTPDDVRISVDLFGLSKGTYKLPLKASAVPESLQVVNIVPDIVEVTIEGG